MNFTRKKILIILIILVVTPSIWLGFEFRTFFKAPLVAKDKAAVEFVFTQGDSVKKAANSLKNKNLIKKPLFFVLFTRLSGIDHDLKAGDYIIEPGTTTAYGLVQKMAKGEVAYQNMTIVEGWTFAQIISALNNNENIKHTIEGLDDSQIMEKIGHTGEIPEGRFAPDTYLFAKGTADLDILFTAYQLMQKNLQTAWSNKAADVSYYCLYEVLVVASLIEKETADAQEKPVIAGVILKRLAKGMGLQIDAAIIYGLGDKFSGKLKKSDFKIDTPYNTYKHRGLPPTPICMPGKDSIEAALHPVFSDSLYYVAKGDGTHVFSGNLKEHAKARQKYFLNK